MDLSSINFRSPVVWIVIIGGGVAVYFLYQHFAGSGSSSSANASGATPYPPTNTYVIEEPPETEPAAMSPSTKPIVGPPHVPPPDNDTDNDSGDKDNDSGKRKRRKHEHTRRNRRVGTIKPEASPESSPSPTSPGTPRPLPQNITPAAEHGAHEPAPAGYLGPPEAFGGGPNMDYTHVPTWPYGGQMIRSRLG